VLTRDVAAVNQHDEGRGGDRTDVARVLNATRALWTGSRVDVGHRVPDVDYRSLTSTREFPGDACFHLIGSTCDQVSSSEHLTSRWEKPVTTVIDSIPEEFRAVIVETLGERAPQLLASLWPATHPKIHICDLGTAYSGFTMPAQVDVGMEKPERVPLGARSGLVIFPGYGIDLPSASSTAGVRNVYSEVSVRITPRTLPGSFP
jgi:hypothetical protein